VEQKVEMRIKQSASEIEQKLRSRLFSMLRLKSLTRGLFGGGRSEPLDPDEDPYLPAPHEDDEPNP